VAGALLHLRLNYLYLSSVDTRSSLSLIFTRRLGSVSSAGWMSDLMCPLHCIAHVPRSHQVPPASFVTFYFSRVQHVPMVEIQIPHKYCTYIHGK